MDLRGMFKQADEKQAFPAGATIFAEGTPGDVMYVVLDGEVEVRVGNESIEIVGPGYRGGDGAYRFEGAKRNRCGPIRLSIGAGR
jgi:CRP-like cAMP-binding protein